MTDIIKKPPHYAQFEIGPSEFIMLNNLPFHVGNIIKYACRAGYKGYEGKNMTEAEIIDLQKVQQYAQMRINQLKGNKII